MAPWRTAKWFAGKKLAAWVEYLPAFFEHVNSLVVFGGDCGVIRLLVQQPEQFKVNRVEKTGIYRRSLDRGSIEDDFSCLEPSQMYFRNLFEARN